ncbi:digestive cysteine proteinase 1 isoform X2 [Venturia canescens]|nr:digestive cysteine proteinase 1 isoform X2 [Venturia canescens]
MILLGKLILFLTAFCSVLGAEKPLIAKSPVFSDGYIARGTLYIPYAEIREPFFAWYDKNEGRSRIDYYGGMVKTYQLAHDGPHGSSIKIVPMTNEKVLNKPTCLKVEGNEDMQFKPQTIVPDTTGMKFVENEMINGLTCEKWQMHETIGEKSNKYTLWIRYKKSTTVRGVMEPIPVRYEMRGFNSLLGSHYDHYYLEYDWYSFETPDGDVFQIAENMTCEGFPGPGDKHVYTFNPMREYIHNHDAHVNEEFDDFIETHNKTYKNHVHHAKRKEIFRQNLRFIHSTNRANLGYELEINHLADRSELELKALRGKLRSKVGQNNGGQPFPYSAENLLKANLPESWDWRLRGAVTPVKDQSVCGSCWSFGTTGAVEGAYFVAHGQLVRLSQQALIDCSWGYGNNGCDGGEDFRAYQWIMKHGLPTEEAYGDYLGQDSECHVDNVTKTAKLSGFVNVTPGSADAMKLAMVQHGPISVAIDASHKTFSFYSKGIYYDEACGNREENLDHAVLAVGYGTLDGQDYWLVKNSWSNYWGNDGYILMAQKNNNCGVMTAPTYAVVV